jgi:TolA-binding protein
MLNLEQVKQLEAKIAKAINYVERVSREKGEMLRREAETNALLEASQKREAELRAKLESCQGRIDELELLASRFKEDQGKIEEGILSALDRLSQFEKDMEKKPEGKAWRIRARGQDGQSRGETGRGENGSGGRLRAGRRNRR